jgi:hypothetical protein
MREITIGGAVPITSAIGAKTRGPTAKPATKRATPRLITSCDTPYSSAVMLEAAPKMLDAVVTEKTMRNGAVARSSFVD